MFWSIPATLNKPHTAIQQGGFGLPMLTPPELDGSGFLLSESNRRKERDEWNAKPRHVAERLKPALSAESRSPSTSSGRARAGVRIANGPMPARITRSATRSTPSIESASGSRVGTTTTACAKHPKQAKLVTRVTVRERPGTYKLTTLDAS